MPATIPVVVTIGDFLRSSILAFDPGSLTGVARLDAVGDKGRVIYTHALDPERLLQFLSDHLGWPGKVIVETGPMVQHRSPITRRVETFVTDTFPNAHRVQPSQWKNHPAATCTERFRTKHEKDAARIARWFYVQEKQNGQDAPRANPARTDARSTRHQRH